MNSEILNPMSIIPPPAAEGGAAVAASAIQPQNPIVPTFKLPNDGAKPEDRKFKDGRQYSAEELKEQEADITSARFSALSDMVLKPSFADMFYRLYDGKVSEVDTLQRQAFEKADIGKKGTYSSLLLTNPEAPTKRRNSYERIGFYHETPPGVRFKGRM